MSVLVKQRPAAALSGVLAVDQNATTEVHGPRIHAGHSGGQLLSVEHAHADVPLENAAHVNDRLVQMGITILQPVAELPSGARFDYSGIGPTDVVVLPGGVGTFNELFWVWTLLLHDRDDVRTSDPGRRGAHRGRRWP